MTYQSNKKKESIVLNKQDLNIALRASENAKTTKSLLEQGADPNARGSIYNRTALHWVRDPESVKLLVLHKGDLNARDQHSNTPLHTARSKEIVQALLDAGADPNVFNMNRRTPLHVFADNPEIVKILLEYGANPDSKDRQGYTHSTLPSHGQEISLSNDRIKANEAIQAYFNIALFPSLFIGVLILAISNTLIKKLFNNPPKVLFLLGVLGFLMAPIPFHVFYLLFSHSVYPLLYFIPGSYILITGLSYTVCFLIFWATVISYRWKNSNIKSLKLFVQHYIISFIPYCVLLPYYCLWGVVFYERKGDATGDYIAFFGVPYLLIFLIVALRHRNKIWQNIVSPLQ